MLRKIGSTWFHVSAKEERFWAWGMVTGIICAPRWRFPRGHAQSAARQSIAGTALLWPSPRYFRLLLKIRVMLWAFGFSPWHSSPGPRGLAFEPWALGHSPCALGLQPCWAVGVWLWASVLEIRVLGLRAWPSGLGLWALGFGPWDSRVGLRGLALRPWALDVGLQLPWGLALAPSALGHATIPT